MSTLEKLGKVELEWQNVLDFNAATDDGDGNGADQTCQAPVRSPQLEYQHLVLFTDQMSHLPPYQQCHCTEDTCVCHRCPAWATGPGPCMPRG